MEFIMTNKLAKLGVAIILSGTVVLTSTPAMARHRHYEQGYNEYYDNGDYYRQAQYERAQYERQRYERQRYEQDRYSDGYRCKPKGTGGLIIGAVVGGLLGREVVGRRGDRTAGAIVGAGAGALAGRALHRAGSDRC
jgi:Glycine zipper 2TM domain